MVRGIVRIVVTVGLIAALAGCEALTGDVGSVDTLPTLTPSPFASPTPAVGVLATPTPSTPTMTPTITLTPASSPTPLFALLPTLSAAELTAGPSQTANALPKPTIVYFKAFPPETETVAPGDTVTLFWSTSGATTAAITRLNEDGSRGRSWSVQVPDGYLQITADGAEHNEQYALTVTNGMATVEKTVGVTVACVTVWFFAPAPTNGCPEANPTIVQANIQEFERGRMFWLSATNDVIVLFNDTQSGGTDNRPAWLRVPNPWVEGMPENDPSLQAPADGLRQPQRTFGQVWRDTPGLRDRIGWALSDESQFTTTTQRGGGEKGTFYFTDPPGAVIGLLYGGTGWQNISAQAAPTITPTP